MNYYSHVKNYLILSIIGASLIIFLVLFFPINDIKVEFFDKLVVGGLFIISCIFGISLAFKPNWTTTCLDQDIHKIDTKHVREKAKSRIGHHPLCGQFDSHRIQINNEIQCAGCTGLAIGAGISIIITIIYLVFPIQIPKFIFFYFILLGLFFIIFNFTQIVSFQNNAKAHLFSNVLLVIGFFLIVVGLFQSTGKIFFGILGIMTSILWVDTRIILSKWNHDRICELCKDKCSYI